MAAGSRAAPPPPMPMGPPQTPMLDTPQAFWSPWDKWFPKRCLGQMVFKTVPGATDFQKNAWGTCSPELHMEKEYIYIYYTYILHIIIFTSLVISAEHVNDFRHVQGCLLDPPPPLWGGSGWCRMAATVSVYAPRPPCGVGVVLNGCDMVAIILIYAPPVEWECCPLAAMFCVGMLVECCRM